MNAMFKVIYIAPNMRLAERIIKALTEEGLMATKRFLQGNESGPVEILVPQSEAAEAHEVLSNVLCAQPSRSGGVQKREDS